MFNSLNSLPQVTKNLLLLNIVMYIASLILVNQGIDLFNLLSVYNFQSPNFEPYQLITSMFMHSQMDFMHIVMNMFVLVVFGSFLEKIWGSKHFFIFYILCGFGADVLDQIMGYIEISKYNSLIMSGGNYVNLKPYYDYLMLKSSLGASGALFGVMAGFAYLFPNTELMLMFVPFPIKAKYLIGGYFVYELYKSTTFGGFDNINHIAHVGGAITGVLIIFIRRKFDKKNFY